MMSTDKPLTSRNSGKRRTIGGRGREWAHKCHKLLETMLELGESEPFRNPVDSIKYPDYYTICNEPMDLSKVMVKLHTGEYGAITEFASDVRLIFSNWAKYNNDAKSDVFVKRMRLSWWFEAEFEKIADNLTLIRSRPSQGSPHHRVLSSDDIGIDLTTMRSLTPPPPSTIVSTSSLLSPRPSTPNPPPTQKIVSPPQQRARPKQNPPKEEYTALLNTLRKLQDCSKKNSQMDTDVVVAIRGGMCTVIPQAPGARITVNPTTSVITPTSNTTTSSSGATSNGTNGSSVTATTTALNVRGDVATTSALATTSTTRTVMGGADTPLLILPDTPTTDAILGDEQEPLSKRRRRDSTDTVPLHKQTSSDSASNTPSSSGGGGSAVGGSNATTSSSTSPTAANSDSPPPVRIDVTHIWFAMCKNKPQKPVFLTESGFLLHLKKDSKNDIRFAIKADEIVRCVAHLGTSKKQMLFVFVTPSCERKLKTLTEAAGILDETQRNRSCSLIVMFLEPPLNVSRLIHIFWNMGQKSLFGQLFTEVDQQGALQLLANIKPHIMDRIHRPKEGVTTSAANTATHTASGSIEVVSSSTASSNTAVSHTDNARHNHSNNGSSTVSSNGGGLNVPRQSHLRKSSCPQRIEHMPDNDPDDGELSATQTMLLSLATDRQAQQTSQGHTMDVNRSLNRTLEHRDTPAHTNSTHAHVASTSKRSSSLTSHERFMPAVPQLPFVPHRVRNGDGDSKQPASTVTPVTPEWTKPSRQSTTAVPHTSATNVSLDSVLNLSARSRSEEKNLGSDSDLEIVAPSENDSAPGVMQPIGRRKSRPMAHHKSNIYCPEIEDVVMLQEKISLKCPITQQLMRCPMKNRHCGHSYDKEGVEGLISNRAGKARCPVPGCSNDVPLVMKDMNVDISLMEVINDKTRL